MSSYTALNNEEDKIHWKPGQQYEDGSTILMVERITERAPQIAQNQGFCTLGVLCCNPCACCCFCPCLCYSKENMETKMNNSALLVTDESVVFYANEWVPRGPERYFHALPNSNSTINYDQLQDVRVDPQGSCQTCCSCLNPGPGIKFFPVGNGAVPSIWQPYSLNEEELREKKDKIRGYMNSYKKKERQLKDTGRETGGTTGQVRSFCGSCGEKNESLKQVCGACGANMAF